MPAFYAQEVDKDHQHKPVGGSILINNADIFLPPVPPFSGDDGAPLNWVLARTNFNTTGYDDKYLMFKEVHEMASGILRFWVVVWIQDGNGYLVPEIEGHGRFPELLSPCRSTSRDLQQ